MPAGLQGLRQQRCKHIKSNSFYYFLFSIPCGKLSLKSSDSTLVSAISCNSLYLLKWLLHTTDLRRRDDASATGRRCVTFAEGLRVAKDINAMYVETSSLLQEGLKDCFDQAVRWISKNEQGSFTAQLVLMNAFYSFENAIIHLLKSVFKQLFDILSKPLKSSSLV